MARVGKIEQCVACGESWQRKGASSTWLKLTQDKEPRQVPEPVSGRAHVAVAPESFDWDDPFALMACDGGSIGFICPDCYGSEWPASIALHTPNGERIALVFDWTEKVRLAWVPLDTVSGKPSPEQLAIMLALIRSVTTAHSDAWRWHCVEPWEIEVDPQAKQVVRWEKVLEGWHSGMEESAFSREWRSLVEKGREYEFIVLHTPSSNLCVVNFALYVDQSNTATERARWNDVGCGGVGGVSLRDDG